MLTTGIKVTVQFIRVFYEPIKTNRRDKMKIIIKEMWSQETLVELNIDDPSKLTVGQFANLFFEQLSRKRVYSIEPTKYTKRNNIIAEDFQFYYAGRQFGGGAYASYGSNTILAKYIPSNQQECQVHANLSVYGKDNYCLNGHIHINKIDNNQSFEQAKNELIARVHAYIHASGFFSNDLAAKHVKNELNILDEVSNYHIQESHLLPFKKVALQCFVRALREHLPITSRLSISVHEFINDPKYQPLLNSEEIDHYQDEINQLKIFFTSFMFKHGSWGGCSALLRVYFKIHPDACIKSDKSEESSENKKIEELSERFVSLDENTKKNPELANIPPRNNQNELHRSQLQPEDTADYLQSQL